MLGIYAHIRSDGVVDNVIVLDPDDCGAYPLAGLVPLAGIVPAPGIGWSYNGTAWTPPPNTGPL